VDNCRLCDVFFTVSTINHNAAGFFEEKDSGVQQLENRPIDPAREQ
jgi:hypothetical protein